MVYLGACASDRRLAGSSMTPPAFAAALASLHLTQIEFARLTGLTNGTVSRWVRGVRPVPLWAERLLDAWAVAGVPGRDE